ncbi:MAG: hypothetical protein ABFD92_10570 [Planctomycetaceae bacterium]
MKRQILLCTMAALFLAGCAQQSCSEMESRIASLQDGLTMNEVEQQLQPDKPMVLSVPALSYFDERGGMYYIRFGKDGKVLDAVRFPSDAKSGTYILPHSKRGQRFEPPYSDW